MTPDSPTSLLLLSNSTNYSAKFLSHALEPIDGFLRGSDLVFVPFALADHQAYGELVAGALSPLGVNVHVAPPDANGAALINEASAVFIGGGNTFRLLKTLQTLGVMQSIRERYAAGGLRYMGSSAGTNLACPTIRTTNDMPIVSPEGFEGLGLVPFQINAHFQDDEAFEGHMGETRRTRLNEFLEENDVRPCWRFERAPGWPATGRTGSPWAARTAQFSSVDRRVVQSRKLIWPPATTCLTSPGSNRSTTSPSNAPSSNRLSVSCACCKGRKRGRDPCSPSEGSGAAPPHPTVTLGDRAGNRRGFASTTVVPTPDGCLAL